MRKLLALVLTLVLVLGSFSALSSTTAADTEKRVLRVAGESWEINKIFLEEAEKIYEAAHPDVDVQIITYADTSVLSTYMLDWAQGNTDVDLVFMDGGISFAKQFYAKDLIYDFDADLHFFDSYDRNLMMDGVIELGEVDGKLINFPVIYEVYGVSKNVEMFKAAGLVDESGNPLPITSWDDFYDFAEKLTIKDENGVVVQQGASIQFGNNILGCIHGAMVADTGDSLAEDGVSYNFDSDSFRAILANWQKGVQAGYYSVATFADNSGGRNALKAGNLAMCYEAAGRWLEAANMLGEGTMALDLIPGAQGNYGFACGASVPKCSPNADLACSFIAEALLGEYVQTNTFTQYGKMSVVKEYYNAVIESQPVWGGLGVSTENVRQKPIFAEEQKFMDGVCAILQAGLVDANTTVDQMVASLVELQDSIKK